MRRRPRARRSAPVAILAAGLSCATPAPRAEPAEAVAGAPAAESPTCGEAPAGALAILDDTPCSWSLIVDAGALFVVAHDGAVGWRVVPPDACSPAERCTWDGVMSPLGPVVIASLIGGASEVPEGRWVGAALDDARIYFVPLWWGEGSIVDGTDQGPPFALAPWICGEELVLRVEGRLAEAAVEAPPPGLVAWAGIYRSGEGGLSRAADDPGGACAPLLGR